MSDIKEKLQPLDGEAFAQALGHVTWLMTMSPDHKDLPISMIEELVSAPLVFKQVRLFMKGKQPIGVVMWAYASDEVKARVASGDRSMGLEDWRSGPEVIVVDCVAPFGGKDEFITRFMADADAAKKKNIGTE